MGQFCDYSVRYGAKSTKLPNSDDIQIQTNIKDNMSISMILF